LTHFPPEQATTPVDGGAQSHLVVQALPGAAPGTMLYTASQGEGVSEGMGTPLV